MTSKAIAAFFLGTALTLAACSDDDGPEDAAGGSDLSSVGDAGIGDVTPGTDARPRSDASVGADATAPDAAAADAMREDTGPTVAFEDFCTAAGETLCTATDRCACGLAGAACRARISGNCAGDIGSSSVAEALAEGRIVYDGNAAAAAIAALEGMSCEGFESLGWRHVDLFDFRGVFEGTLSPGTSCTIRFSPLQPSECANGACLSVGAEYACVELVDIGGTCGEFSACVDHNANLGDVRYTERGLLWPCVTGVGPTGTCEARQLNGARCEDDDWCESLRCGQSICEGLLLNNAFCQNDEECASGFCFAGPANTTCSNGNAGNGEACDENPACLSDYCAASSQCEARICSLLD